MEDCLVVAYDCRKTKKLICGMEGKNGLAACLPPLPGFPLMFYQLNKPTNAFFRINTSNQLIFIFPLVSFLLYNPTFCIMLIYVWMLWFDCLLYVSQSRNTTYNCLKVPNSYLDSISKLNKKKGMFFFS